MLRFIISHEGVPIGDVILPERRVWAGGLLQPYAAFERIRPIVTAAVSGSDSRVTALRVLKLPLNEVPKIDDLPKALGAAVLKLARLNFELRDEAGLAVPVEVVRLAHPGDVLGVRVYVFFRTASAPIPAMEGMLPTADTDAANL